MGIIITKFRKKKTTYEVLEKLENEIQSIEEFRRNTEQTQKKMVGRFIFISICVYCIIALIFYFYFFPASAYERIIYIIPLIILPMLLILIKRFLSWYYNRKIVKNQKKLSGLKDEKKKILEEVMDKETYKVAKTILEKFAPEQIKKNPVTNVEATPVQSQVLTPVMREQSQRGLRYRSQFSTTTQLPPATPRLSILPSSYTPLHAKVTQPQNRNILPSVGPPMRPGTPMLLPRAILPKDRSVLDKMVDYLIGDGPSNRYALICRNCSSHNGMALKEEFDYLSFRCCYCSSFNPARKKRPAAPKLDTPLSITGKSVDVSDSDSKSDSDSESEQRDRPVITELPSDSPEESCNEDKAEVDKLPDLEETTAMDVDTHEGPSVDDEPVISTETKKED